VPSGAQDAGRVNIPGYPDVFVQAAKRYLNPVKPNRLNADAQDAIVNGPLRSGRAERILHVQVYR
jgi:hypothetical protein